MSLVSPDQIAEFLTIIHNHVALLSRGIADPGKIQLICIDPDNEDGVTAHRFAIGDVDGSVRIAIKAAEKGLNVYLECRTVRSNLRGIRTRGAIDDSVFIFGFVIDNDSDTGKASKVHIPCSIEVRTSGGNSHQWILLDAPIMNPAEAQALGARIKAGTEGADSCSATITQPFRVAGTPTLPNPRKRARGRVPTPTRIIERSDYRATLEGLLAAFPQPAQQRATQDDSESETIYDADMASITSALLSIPNRGDGQDYDTWLRIMAGLHWAAANCDSAATAAKIRARADAWSKRSSKFEFRKQEKTWRSFKERRDNPVTIKSVYQVALHYGWTPPPFDPRPFMKAMDPWIDMPLPAVLKIMSEDIR